MRFHALRVAAVDRLCDDAVAVTFDVPAELRTRYAFRPGQSLTVRLGDQRRTYSICAPTGAAPRIGVRELPGGRVSGWLVHGVRPGDRVEVAPPSGTFTPGPGAAGRHVLIAAGSGITPVLSITASLLADPTTQITLLYGNRRAASAMFAEELADLKDAHPARLQVVHLVSREAREPAVLTGRLDAAKLRTLLPRLIDVPAVDGWWLCGPAGMVTDATGVLAGFGVPAVRVHRELFWTGAPPPEPVAADPAPGDAEVTVVLDGRSTTVPVPPGGTLLDAARRSRPDVPFACRAGVCGTCRARLVEGEVRMRQAVALEADDLAAGYVLTCQAAPATATVTVDFDR